MLMNQKSIAAVIVACLCCLSCTYSVAQSQELQLTMEKQTLLFRVSDNGTPQYAVRYNNEEIIQWSALGFVLDVDSNFSQGFEITDMVRTSKDETWQPVWGETDNIRNHYNEMSISLRKKTDQNRLLKIVFRVFEDGVAFRYEFPKQANLKYFVVKDERTFFNLNADAKAFWIPGDYDTNEYMYTTSMLSEIDNRNMVKNSTDIAVRTAPDPYAVQTPLMLKSLKGLYINIHEASQVNYPAMQLHVNRANFGLSSSLVPDAVNNKAYLHAPAKTPWRTIIVSDQATAILASKMILNLNEPSVIQETSWIKPMKFVGVWWEMQTGKSSWNFSDFADSTNGEGKPIPNGRHGANTANVKRYIDFASANGIEGVLVEGWNLGWEDWFGNWKENVFNFTTPYPDFDLAGLTAYAKSKNVQLIMHNETSGSATDYERQLDTAFRFMNQYGYTSVKTGYVGKIIPRGEYHDGQWMTNHYERVAQKAAQHKVMIDVHEPNRPTGLHRTYPNWMASEAGRGNEYNAFSIGSPPEHETILPFTRLMGGPMDYTPGIFKLQRYVSWAPERQMHSTLAKQLALYVTMYSPLQMAADYPEHYEAKKDAFQFIRDVPVNWSDTKIISAEPGDHLTIARREKGKDNWYIGAVTDESKRTTTIPLTFLRSGTKYRATVYKDAKDADWKSNPEAYVIESSTVDKKTILKIDLAPGGGCAISIVPVR